MTFWLFVFICVVNFYESTSHPAKNVMVYPLMAYKNKEKDEKEAPETTTAAEEKKKGDCFCSKIYDPVCGSDNRSYYNLCQLECENKSKNVTVQHLGNCIPYRY